MATCSYSSLLRENTTLCGSNWINPEDFQCVALRDCSKDVSSHLKSCSVADDRIKSEIQLLLARAGMVLVFIIMPYLSTSFGNATMHFFFFEIFAILCYFPFSRAVYCRRFPFVIDGVPTASRNIWGWLEERKGPMSYTKRDCRTQGRVNQRRSWN